MTTWSSKVRGIIDGHVHLWGTDGEGALEAIREATGIAKMGLASIQDPKAGTGLPQYRHLKISLPFGTELIDETKPVEASAS